MSKVIVAFSIACACAAGAFADHGEYEQWQNPWFKAIGASATKSDTKSVGGSWETFNDGVSFTSGKMVLDQDDTQSTTFTISADATNEQTIVEITATAAFYPVLEGDLPPSLPSGAKAAFAVVKATSGGALSYRAMVLGASEWTTLGGTPSDAEVSVLIQLNLRDNKAKFFVGGTEISATDGISFTGEIPSGLTINGCGTIASVNAEVQVGVAKWNEMYYGTIAEAQTAATASSGSDLTISVIEPTAEPVTVTSGTKIEDNGNMTGTVTVPEGQQLDVVVDAETVGGGASGTYTVPVKTDGNGTVVLDLPTSVTDHKEIREQTKVAGGIQVTLQTRGDILTNAATKAGCSLDVNDNLRNYLTENANTPYMAADSNSDGIGDALKAESSNKLKLWQNYTLGIQPTDSVAPAGSASGLAIPTIDTTKYSGDYTISYKAGSADSTDNPKAIPIPHSTGNHKINITLSPKH